METPAMDSSSRSPLLFVAVALAIVIAAVGGWWVGRGSQEPAPPETEGSAVPAMGETAAPPAKLESIVVPVGEEWTSALDEAVAWSGADPAAASCSAIDAQLDEVCSETGAPCALAKSAAIALARKPPTASGELYQHKTVIENTFHLFRTLGRRDLERLRDASRKSDAERELLALAFYRWLASRETCGTGDEKALTVSVLNDYAVYALSTLGGQAYMRRQSPELEGLATFYALLTVDRAIASGKDAHGLDPRPFVARAEGLMERDDLALRDEYARALQGFRTRWGGF